MAFVSYYDQKKRMRRQTAAEAEGRYSRAEKGKQAAIVVVHEEEEEEEEQQMRPEYLYIKICRGVDIDKDLRQVTGNRFYGVRAWINPDEGEFLTSMNRPNLVKSEVDPVWDDEGTLAVDEEDVKEGSLHLELVRGLMWDDAAAAAAAADIPAGPSNMRWVVGRVQLKLDQLLPGNKHVALWLRLMQKNGASQWRLEGHIRVELLLRMLPL